MEYRSLAEEMHHSPYGMVSGGVARLRTKG